MWRLWLLGCALAACGNGEARSRHDVAGNQAAFDRYRRPELVIRDLALAPGDVVADVGAGRGYLSHRLAAAVGPRGRVVATDIDAAALVEIGAAAAGEAAIETRTVAAAEPDLEPGAYDLILLSEVDQYLPDREAYLTRLRPALRPHGRIAVVNRRLYRAPLLAAAAKAGLTLASEAQDLPAHFLVTLVPR